MNKINVLIFPAGEINSVELHDALSYCVNIKVFGASSVDRHGEYIFENYISGLPFISSEIFIDVFNSILTKNNIDIIFPTHDTVAEFLSENSEKIRSKIIVADRYTARICRDKKATYELFKEDFFCPKIYDCISELPVFIKPRLGQGSVGAKLIENRSDIPSGINLDNYVICEYLPEDEFTVDCITDSNGILKSVLPRSRKRILAGISVSGKNETLTTEIEEIAQRINEKLTFRGLWFFQIKQDSQGQFKLLEISARCAGTMCLSRAMGVNLPLLSVYVAMDQPISIIKNNYNLTLDRTLISRYKADFTYEIVYCDYDDTLVLNDRVNLMLICFLYQCKNKNIKIILITKHSHNPEESLKKYSICEELFSSIIHLEEYQEKSDYINPCNAIFIDNSFKERDKVFKKYGIPVFDVDAVEVLLDWRI